MNEPQPTNEDGSPIPTPGDTPKSTEPVRDAVSVAQDTEAIRFKLLHVEDCVGDLSNRWDNARQAGADLCAVVDEVLEYATGDPGVHDKLHAAMNAFRGRESANFNV